MTPPAAGARLVDAEGGPATARAPRAAVAGVSRVVGGPDGDGPEALQLLWLTRTGSRVDPRWHPGAPVALHSGFARLGASAPHPIGPPPGEAATWVAEDDAGWCATVVDLGRPALDTLRLGGPVLPPGGDALAAVVAFVRAWRTRPTEAWRARHPGLDTLRGAWAACEHPAVLLDALRLGGHPARSAAQALARSWRDPEPPARGVGPGVHALAARRGLRIHDPATRAQDAARTRDVQRAAHLRTLVDEPPTWTDLLRGAGAGGLTGRR